METLWGQIIPIPADQVTAVHDNDACQFGDVTVTAWDTPGHAWHHHTYVIDDIAFTGDVGAVRAGNKLDIPCLHLLRNLSF